MVQKVSIESDTERGCRYGFYLAMFGLAVMILGAMLKLLLYAAVALVGGLVIYAVVKVIGDALSNKAD